MQQREGVAHPVGGRRSEGGGGEHGVNGDNLLEKGSYRPAGVPKDGGKVRKSLPFLHPIK